MSELRQNLASKEWVVIVPKRGDKPNKSVSQIVSEPVSHNEYEPDCPFCPGNEGKFEIVEQKRISNDTNGWAAKAILNKYSIFADFESCPPTLTRFQQVGIYRQLTGCGNHEVIIETNKHNQSIINLSGSDVKNILVLYVDRYLAFKSNPNNLIALIFKNYGVLAGQTQPHSHSQMVGSRVVPGYIRSLLHEAEKHFDDIGSCVFCDMIQFEQSEGKRIVLENEDYIAFVPFAAGSEHETWILPKRHRAGLSELQGAGLENLSRILERTLKKVHSAVGNPDFNYVFRLAPYPLENVPFYHWHIQVLPRTKIMGGFERGTRIPVNTVLPEESARMLRECQ